MLPIMLLLGKSVEPWIEQSLSDGYRCAVVCESSTHLRHKYADYAADWRLIPLCVHDNTTFQRLLKDCRSRASRRNEILNLLDAAIGYVGIPKSLIVSDADGTAAEVLEFIGRKRFTGISEMTFQDISEDILKTLRMLKFKRLGVTGNQRQMGENVGESPISFPSSTDRLIGLFSAEYFRAER